MSFRNLSRIALLSLALFGLSAAFHVQSAAAQMAPQVGVDGKGISAGAILGAELGLFIPALAGLEDEWGYIVFPIAGAALGAVGGYFALEDSGADAEISVAILAISLALVVPTIVGTLALTAYSPDDEGNSGGGEEDEDTSGTDDGEDSSSGSSGSGSSGSDSSGSGSSGSDSSGSDSSSSDGGGSEARLRARSILAGGPGLLRFDRGAFLLGIPMVQSLARYTEEERVSLALNPSAGADVNIPLFSGSF